MKMDAVLNMLEKIIIGKLTPEAQGLELDSDVYEMLKKVSQIQISDTYHGMLRGRIEYLPENRFVVAEVDNGLFKKIYAVFSTSQLNEFESGIDLARLMEVRWSIVEIPEKMYNELNPHNEASALRRCECVIL